MESNTNATASPVQAPTAPSSTKDAPDPELVRQWTETQEVLRHKIITEDTEPWQSDLTKLKLVAGLDISYPKDAHSQGPCTAFTAVVICSFPELEIVYEDVQEVRLDTPYVPGFLAFRESASLIAHVDKVISGNPAFRPDVLFVDGNGLLHPQECGLACHIGLSTNIPTIGVAKNLHHLDGIKTEKVVLQGLAKAGDYVHLRDKAGKVIGMALKTGDEAINPVYVSIGHKTSLESARKVVLGVSKFRVPEPIRFADGLSREQIRKSLETEGGARKKGKARATESH